MGCSKSSKSFPQAVDITVDIAEMSVSKRDIPVENFF